MFRSNFQEERPEPDSKLQAVFSKLTGVLPKAGDLGNGVSPKTMSSDIIESVLTDTPIPIPQNWGYDPYPNSEDDCNAVAIRALSQRLETELRAAKRTHLSCGEVLLPCGLLQRIARDIIAMAESEPCGLRGCTLYLHFEGEGNSMKLSTIKCDPLTASTFELYLTLKQTTAGWNSFLPQFINCCVCKLALLTRTRTVVRSARKTGFSTVAGYVMVAFFFVAYVLETPGLLLHYSRSQWQEFLIDNIILGYNVALSFVILFVILFLS